MNPSHKFIAVCKSLLVFVVTVQISVTSASRCLCETDPVKTAYCNKIYSFKGTVLEVKDANRFKRDVANDESSYSFELNEIEILLPPVGLTHDIAVEYRIRIDSIFGGVSPALLKQEITMYSTVKERLCGNPELKADYGYLFQVDDMMNLDPCERIVRYKDVAKTDRHGLHKHYRFTCKPPQ